MDVAQKKLIISLTSYPARIKTIHQVIESLFKQTLKADKIILWLAPEQFPNKEQSLPEELLNLIPEGLTIDWYHDIKSYKKLIPALIKYPNNIIVTVDDDVIYEEECLERLFVEHLKYPDNVLAHRVHKINYYNHLSKYKNIYYPFKPYCKWEWNIEDLSASFFNFATGVGSILYPPHSLHEEVLNEEKFMNLSSTNDDIWFWAMTVLNNNKARLIQNSYSQLTPIDGTQEEALFHENVLKRKNNIQMRNIFNEYPEIKILLNPFLK